MKHSLLKFLMAVMIGAVMISCTYYEIKPQKVTLPNVVSFSVDVIPIFNANCNASGCHSNGGQPPNLSAANAYNSLTFYGYVDPDNAVESILYQKITTGSMKENASEQDRAIILKWIEQGAMDD